MTNFTLYLVTDRELSSLPLEEAVEQAIQGGCTVVQLREKHACAREFYETALTLRAITRKYHVPLLINDRVDIALAADADGVHLGQSDLPCRAARDILGPQRLIGISAATLEEARKAQADGADYIGVGAVNPTATKPDTRTVTSSQLAQIKAAVSIPVVAIGGIHPKTLTGLRGTGVDGIAVVSAILSQPSPKQAARDLLEQFRGLRHA